ncbi:MAG: Hpt domain-containing protein [Planctomycetota bacterium]|jgi:HPt (histidine-containing phosphotransfer) domain-containing protein
MQQLELNNSPQPGTPHSQELPDWSHALRQVGGSRTALEEVLQIFLAECDQLYNRIQHAAESRNWQDLNLAAHSAKSVFRLLRLQVAMDRAFKLEQAASQQCGTSVPELIPVVCGDVRQSAAWCQQYLNQSAAE